MLAVVVAGLADKHRFAQSELSEEWPVQQAINTVLVMPVFSLFGITLPWSAWVELGWTGLGFVLAVLLLLLRSGVSGQ